MAIRITKKPAQSIAAPESQPWDTADTKPQQTLLQALEEFSKNPKKRKLIIVHNATSTTYEVEGYETETHRATLHGPNKARLRPLITVREDALYTPVWR